MISISNTSVDTAGNIIFDNLTRCRIGEMPARVSRQATLDGGSVIVHGGTSHGDRTFYIEGSISTVQATAIKHLHEDTTSVLVSCSEGLFVGAISRCDINNGYLKATLLIKEKVE